ncbi:uncharacterized protein V1516DRAFT_298218 [Lipomyces oligophaga]|uniref:uncharacterized protein n=1 Tax=Lipomyces oligophaga TaxID=45792 RepID=UPI0034CD27C8
MYTVNANSANAGNSSTPSHSNPGIITQVSANSASFFSSHDVSGFGHAPDSIITVDARGQKFHLRRDELMSLPESVLLCLFPNGIFIDGQGQMVTTLSGADSVTVDFSPICFEYVLSTFRNVSSESKRSTSGSPNIPSGLSLSSSPASILAARPSIIVLQEDLDYFVVPPSKIAHKVPDVVSHAFIQKTPSSPSPPPASPAPAGRFSRIFHGSIRRASLDRDSVISRSSHFTRDVAIVLPEPYDIEHPEKFVPESPNYADMVALKLGVGAKLLAEKGIFAALKRLRQITSDPALTSESLPHGETPDHLKSAGTAEKHLLDMLCSSGFTITDEWGFREREPGKTIISSLALVRLLATVPSPATSSSPSTSVSPNPMAQKLLLFWRKPARKCWWDQVVMKGIEGFDPEVEVKVHIRRMWTLELSVVGSL